MNIGVIGTGYVGLVTGACLADRGHTVICVDIDEEKIAKLREGFIPIFEPGLEPIVRRNHEIGRLQFTTSLADAAREAEVLFFAVGTPPKLNGSADLQYVYQAAEDVGRHLNHYAVVVSKSTVPVGTARRVKQLIAAHYKGEFDVASNPEFLREGHAVEDFMKPNRIVVGVESERAREIMERLYRAFPSPKLFPSVESAELTKYASNAFLATKISFINEIANICEATGADVHDVAAGMGLDDRIGPRFLSAGLGYGGSCLPKDVRALSQIAGMHGSPFTLLQAVMEVNHNRRWQFFRKVREALGSLEGKSIAVWGLAFKPNTDDIRESVALDLIDRFLEEGASVQAYDPVAQQNAQSALPGLICANSALEAARSADAVLLITEWDEFKSLDARQIKDVMRGDLVFDGRNVLDPHQMREAGLRYHGIGRPVIPSDQVAREPRDLSTSLSRDFSAPADQGLASGRNDSFSV